MGVAQVVVERRVAGLQRHGPLERRLHRRLRQAEFLEKIRIPVPPDNAVIRCHKLSKRFDQDISAVCSACYLELDGEKVADFRMACGGMAATIKRAENCEAAMAGKPWSTATIEAGVQALGQDFEPISDMRATGSYRMRALQNLLRRFYLESRDQIESSVYDYGR